MDVYNHLQCDKVSICMELTYKYKNIYYYGSILYLKSLHSGIVTWLKNFITWLDLTSNFCDIKSQLLYSDFRLPFTWLECHTVGMLTSLDQDECQNFSWSTRIKTLQVSCQDVTSQTKFFKRDLSSSMDKGAGSYLAGMAVAIPILNVDGRRHTNNFSKNI